MFFLNSAKVLAQKFHLKCVWLFCLCLFRAMYTRRVTGIPILAVGMQRRIPVLE